MKIDFKFVSDLPVWLKTSIVIAIVLAILVVFFMFARYTDIDQGLCRPCHPTIHQMWESSNAHPAGKVSCHECHANHLDAFPEDDTNIFAHYRDKILPGHFYSSSKVINDNCIRCHADIPELKEVKNTRIVKISHAKHFKAEKVKIDDCLVCHQDLAHDRYSVATNRPRMQGCFLGECHVADKKEDRCELCHFVKLVDKEKVLEKIDKK